MTTVRLLLPVGQLPPKSVFTKRTGSQRFIADNTIKLYNPTLTEIRSEPGCVFIFDVNNPTNISAMPTTTEVLWEVTMDRLAEWVYSQTRTM